MREVEASRVSTRRVSMRSSRAWRDSAVGGVLSVW